MLGTVRHQSCQEELYLSNFVVSVVNTGLTKCLTSKGMIILISNSRLHSRLTITSQSMEKSKLNTACHLNPRSLFPSLLPLVCTALLLTALYRPHTN